MALTGPVLWWCSSPYTSLQHSGSRQIHQLSWVDSLRYPSREIAPLFASRWQTSLLALPIQSSRRLGRRHWSGYWPSFVGNPLLQFYFAFRCRSGWYPPLTVIVAPMLGTRLHRSSRDVKQRYVLLDHIPILGHRQELPIPHSAPGGSFITR